MQISVIAGSHRVQSQSNRVAGYVSNELKSVNIQPNVVSLAGNPLPLWDEEVWEGGAKWKERWSPIAKQLRESDGFVVISPEWAGMVPPGLKNLMLLCSTAEVGHKPALIITVSSGMGGSYPVSELRTSSYKNNRIVYIPEHVIIRNVEEMLVGSSPANEHDASVRGRIRHGLLVLAEYAKALKGVRESGVVDYKTYPYGM